MGKPIRNPQKARRRENDTFNANPEGEVRVDRYGHLPREERNTAILEREATSPGDDSFTKGMNYSARARELGIKRITNKEKEWVLVDGVEVESQILNKKWKYLKPGDRRIGELLPEVVIDRYNCVGTYDSNNGVTTFVDEGGNKYAAPYSDERVRVLENAGYHRKGQSVPFSNGELPIDPALRKRFLKGFYRLEQIGEKSQKKTLERKVATVLFFGLLVVVLSIFALNFFEISDVILFSPLSGSASTSLLFSLPLLLICSILFGVTMKLADCFNEHGFKWFKGDAILFGILFGIFGGLLILGNPLLTNLYLALLLVNVLRFRVDALNHGLAATIMFFSFLFVMGNFSLSYFAYFFLTFAFFGILFNYALPLSKIKGFWGTIFELRFFYFLITFLFSVYTAQWIVFISMALFQIGYNITFYYVRRSKNYKQVEDYFGGD